MTQKCKTVPVEPTEQQWGGLARDIVMWMQITPAPWYGSKLHTHLRMLGCEIPEWLAKEIPDADRSPAKGDIAVAIYKAMVESAPEQPMSRDRIREIFMQQGFTIKDGQTDLKQYVYDAAYALLAAEPKQPVQEPVTALLEGKE